MHLTFAHKKMLTNLTKWSLVILAALILVIIDIFWLIKITPEALDTLSLTNLFSFIPPVVCLSIGLYLIKPFYRLLSRLLDPPMNRYLDNTVNAANGVKGENLVYRELYKILDIDQYKIKRNFKIPNKKFDYDFIIIGPKGLIVIDVKNHPKTHTTFTQTKAFRKDKNGQLADLFQKDPRKRLEDQIYQLNIYLKKKGLEDIAFKKALLYLNTESIEFKDGTQNIYKTYIIRGLDNLTVYFEKAFLDPKFTPEFCNRVYNLLNH